MNTMLMAKEWPKLKIGEDKFLGYIVAVGVVPPWDDDDAFVYADFAYNDGYDRYKLPRDKKLFRTLIKYLRGNIITPNGEITDMYNKLWLERRKDGYSIGEA